MGISQSSQSSFIGRPGHSQDLLTGHKPGLYDGMDGHSGTSGLLSFVFCICSNNGSSLHNGEYDSPRPRLHSQLFLSFVKTETVNVAYLNPVGRYQEPFSRGSGCGSVGTP